MPDTPPRQFARDVPLAELTTFRLGGSARWFHRADSLPAIETACRWARRTGVPLFVLGGGSNVVIADEGFDGLVLQIALRGLSMERSGRHVVVRASAGETWTSVVDACLALGLAGVECMAGIPGFVGGLPIQNVGAYGQEAADTLVAVEVIDRKTGRRHRFRNDECHFAYRRSRFNTSDAGRFIVLSAEFRLEQDGSPTLAYAALRDAVLAQYGSRPTLRQVADTVVAIRRTKGMVVDDTDFCSRSAGSFFLNPIVTDEELARVRGRASTNGVAVDRMPVNELPDSRKKLSSAWLVEQSGFPKGHRRGDIVVSPKHPLALVNAGRGTAADVRALARDIRSAVAHKFGIELQPEPVFVGWPSDPLAGAAVA